MLKLDIEIYGLPPTVTLLHKVQVELQDAADIKSLLAALQAKIPALAGTVIDPQAGELFEGYALNIDGQFYRRGMREKLAGGEHIVLLAIASGG